MGWTLPEGGATKKTPSKKTPTKRNAEDAGVGSDFGDAKEAAAETPSKKPRARKPKMSKKTKAEAEAEGGSESEAKKIKEEIIADEEV